MRGFRAIAYVVKKGELLDLSNYLVSNFGRVYSLNSRFFMQFYDSDKAYACLTLYPINSVNYPNGDLTSDYANWDKMESFCNFLKRTSYHIGQFVKTLSFYPSANNLHILGLLLKHCPNIEVFHVLPTKELTDYIASAHKHNNEMVIWNKMRCNIRIHRLVVPTFTEKPIPTDKVVDHKNACRQDNRYINLEVVSQEINSQRAA